MRYFMVQLCLASLLVACKSKSEAPPASPAAASAAPESQRLEPSAGEAPRPVGGEEATPSPGEEPKPTAGEEPTPTAGEEPTPAAGEEPTPAAGEEPTPTAGEGDTPKAPPAVPGARVFADSERMAASDCETIVPREFALVAESGTEQEKASAARTAVAEALGKCQAMPYPRVVAECIRAATTASEMFRSCYTLAFRGHDLYVGREFTANDPANAAAEPAMFTQHGDLIRYRKGCGLLFQRLETFVGAFNLCDGETQGPLTTNEDIRQVFAAMSAEQSAHHRMMMGIMANYPSGGTGRYRVCNSSGVCHLE